MSNIDNTAMFKLSYGLFVLTANEGGKDNGCIINTAMQVTDIPKQICIAVNKKNLTCEMIMATGVFNVCVLTESTPFGIFERFGFVSGRDKNKFADLADTRRTENGLLALTKNTNAFISAKVCQTVDCGTHMMFVAEVTEAEVLSSEKSVTYEYYFANIKPAPQKKAKGYVCKICGYVYEGETLPADFECPWCLHGAEDFEPIKD